MADVAENILSTGPANGEITPELLMEAGKTLSRSTLFALRRNYLDTPVIKNKVFRIVGTPDCQHAGCGVYRDQAGGKTGQ